MRLVTFRRREGQDAVGALIAGDQVLNLTAAAGGAPEFSSMLALIESGERGLDTARRLVGAPPKDAMLRLSDVRLRAPIPLPPRMRALSLDPKHLVQAQNGIRKMLGEEAFAAAAPAATSGKDLNYLGPGWYATPVYWFMDRHCVSGPDDHVKWPSYSDWIDYELEIAAVIAKEGINIPKERASDFIFGYTIVNDLSARDAQFIATKTGLSITAKGKDFEGSYPMGPCIITKDEVDETQMHTTLRVNGAEWARGSTKERHWSYADGIAYMSQAAKLIPGEVISSATVANCSGLEQARKGKHGDCVELEVAEIGTLRTYID